ncbi:MAG: hypothetical protein AB7G75_06125 [Candidatus Binatia bacterium]
MLSLRTHHRYCLSLTGLLIVLGFSRVSPLQADVIVPDDQIVQGDLCVGSTECVNGESFPDFDLKIKFSDTPGLRFDQTATGGNPAQAWDMGGNEVNFFLQDATRGTFPFKVRAAAPTDSLTVAATGRVGIGVPLGTINPQGNLHIYGSPTADIFNGLGPDLINGPAFNFGYSGFSFGRSSGFFNVRPDASAAAPNPSLRFLTANAQRMIIDRLGNVGIGLTGTNPIPIDRLHVNGNIRVQNGSFIDDGTTLNVPDYVFEPDYKLMPLRQLASYIEREKHLPEIPPANKIKEHGVNLSAMQMDLLKKIEELTLYTLQQEDKLTQLLTQHEQLSADNTQLRKRVSALEAALAQRPSH